MSSAMPKSVRFESGVEERLRAYISRHAGTSASSVTNRLVDEGLRMDEHPGIFFRDGATGRRAVLLGGPDVWEVIRAVKSARQSSPRSKPATIIDIVHTTSGVSLNLIEIALSYWSSYPDEINDWISEADRVEDEALRAWERRQGLLSGS